MSRLFSLLIGGPYAAFAKIGAAILALAALFAKGYASGRNAAKQRHAAEQAKVNEHNMQDIRRANDARANANSGELSDGDGFKRK